MAGWNSNDYRPIPFYFLTTADDADYTPQAVGEALDRLADAGYGGAVLFNKPPTGFSKEDYLSEKWFDVIRTFVEQAIPRGLAIWLNDGFDFPPGDAGGRVEKIAPHLRQQRLHLEDDGTVAVKDVAWGFPCFEEPESSKLHIELVYEAIKKHLGEFFGRGIVGIFSDADNRRMPHAALDGKYFPWSMNFSSEFEKTFGYRVEPHLRSILEWRGGQAAEDYWRLCGRLYQQWFANNRAWCRANGLKYTFHSGDSGPYSLSEIIRSSIFNEGDGFELHSQADFPGTDHELRGLHSCTTFFPNTVWYIEHAMWGVPCESTVWPMFSRPYGDVRAKIAGSAAFLYDAPRAMCEAFAGTNWSCPPNDLRRIAAWQIMLGINFFIPHAVHHRMTGHTKYFAPPELLRGSVLGESTRAFNDWLTSMCEIASRGERVAPIAILDPTEEVWRTGRTFPRYFELCLESNRWPQGCVVAPIRDVVANRKHFRVAINPGMTLSQDVRTQIAAAGVTLIEGHEIDRLSTLVPTNIKFSGTGRPHFMRRKVANGEMLLVANIEDEHDIVETIEFAGRTHTMVLSQGEIAILSPSECVYRTPTTVRASMPLSETSQVTWHAPNSITLFRWEHADGTVVTTDDSPTERFFRWQANEALSHSPRLLVPRSFDAKVTFDGRGIMSASSTNVFDEAYDVFELPSAQIVGDHVIGASAATFAWESPCYLEGEFDVEVTRREQAGAALGFNYYCFRMDVPREASVVLRNRRSILRTYLSWSRQGHAFYSGDATYRLEFAIPAEFRQPVLRLGRVHCSAVVTINGRVLGRKWAPPYDFDLSGFAGPCVAEVRVTNTLGNRLDGCGVPSGLASTPEIVDLAE